MPRRPKVRPAPLPEMIGASAIPCRPAVIREETTRPFGALTRNTPPMPSVGESADSVRATGVNTVIAAPRMLNGNPQG